MPALRSSYCTKPFRMTCSSAARASIAWFLRREERSAFPGNPAAYMTAQMYTIAQVASFKHPAYADERELRSTAMLGGARSPSGIRPVGLLRTCLLFVWVRAAKYCPCQLRRSDLAVQPLPIKWPSTGRFWMRPGMKRDPACRLDDSVPMDFGTLTNGYQTSDSARTRSAASLGRAGPAACWEWASSYVRLHGSHRTSDCMEA